MPPSKLAETAQRHDTIMVMLSPVRLTGPRWRVK
jgi:hypothetical protein